MPTSDADVLAALDFTPQRPLCEAAHGTPDPDNPTVIRAHRCPNNATYILEIHVINACTSPDLTPDGAAIQRVCTAHWQAAMARIKQMCARIAATVPDTTCETCDRPLTDPTRIVTYRIWEP